MTQASISIDAGSTISHLMNPADRGKSDGSFNIQNPSGFVMTQASISIDAGVCTAQTDGLFASRTGNPQNLIIAFTTLSR